MKIGFLIIVRLKSTRLPYKVMLDLGGKSVIERVIERAKAVKGIDRVVLCTSTNEQDAPLVRVAERCGIDCFLGSEEDVLARFLGACEDYKFDGFVGITADNPLFSVELADALVELAKKEDPDHVRIPGLPMGVATYYVKKEALETVCSVKKVVDTEIWGPLMNQPDVFDVRSLELSGWDDSRLTLDTPEDYETLCAVYDSLEFHDYLPTKKAIEFLKQHPESAKNSSIVQRNLSNEEVKRINDFYKDNIDMIKKVKADIYGKDNV